MPQCVSKMVQVSNLYLQRGAAKILNKALLKFGCKPMLVTFTPCHDLLVIPNRSIHAVTYSTSLIHQSPIHVLYLHTHMSPECSKKTLGYFVLCVIRHSCFSKFDWYLHHNTQLSQCYINHCIEYAYLHFQVSTDINVFAWHLHYVYNGVQLHKRHRREFAISRTDNVCWMINWEDKHELHLVIQGGKVKGIETE